MTNGKSESSVSYNKAAELALKICDRQSVHGHDSTIPWVAERIADYVTLLERNNGRLREVLKEALDQTGCDGDLCNYRWHEKARVLLGEDA